jgi:serine/threonine protein kinase
MTGGTLSKRMLPRQPCDPVMVAGWLHEIAAALDYGHHRPQPIVHRDVKPSNLLFHEDGRLCLADFGIARVAAGGTESGEAAQLTRTGMVLGSLSYMAPEQINGHAVPASDQYSTGVLIYEALTGVLPFDAADNYGLIIQHVSAPPPPPSEQAPNLPGGLDAVVLRALAKQAEARYPTVSALAEAFEAALTSAPTAQLARPRPHTTRPVARPVVQLEDDPSKSEPLPGDLRGERPTEAATILRHSAAWAPAGAPPQMPPAGPNRRNWIMPGIFIGLVVIMICVVGLAGLSLLNRNNNTQASATATAGISPTPTQSDATRYTTLLDSIELTTPVFQDALHRGSQNRAWVVTSPGTFTNDGLRLPTRTLVKRGADVTVHATIQKSFSLSDVEVDVSITNNSVIYGLGFFPADAAGYALYLSGDGQYAAVVASTNSTNQTIPWANNPALALTPNQTAHLEILIQSNQFVIFVDKQFITTVPFSPDFTDSNLFALFSQIQNDKPTATVTFSNLKVFHVSGATTDA